MRRVTYSDTAEITCTENNQSLTGEILDFKPEQSLSVSINRQAKVILKYNTRNKNYIGKVGTMEFVSDGPKEIVTIQGKRG